MTRPGPRPEEQEPSPGLSLGAVLGIAGAVLVLLIGAVAVLASTSDADRQRFAASEVTADDTPPLELASVAEATAVHYLAAEADPVTYQEVPCFCGCEEFLGHRHLYDCFVRADDQGWDAHAAGCGICIAESITVQELLVEGHDDPTIRGAVIAQYGAITPTTTPIAATSRS